MSRVERRLTAALLALLAIAPGLAVVQAVTATTLLASGAKTASGTLAISDPVGRPIASAKRGVFYLDLTAAATDVGDTLDVYIQSSVNGTDWNDFIHFTQMLGNGGAKKFEADWSAEITPTTALGAPADAALAAGVKQGPIGPNLRIKWVIVDADVDCSFTLSIKTQVYN